MRLSVARAYLPFFFVALLLVVFLDDAFLAVAMCTSFLLVGAADSIYAARLSRATKIQNLARRKNPAQLRAGPLDKFEVTAATTYFATSTSCTLICW